MDTAMQDNPTMTPDPQPAAPAAAAAPAPAAPAQDQGSDGAVSTTAPSGGGATSPAAPSGAGAVPAAAGASSTPAAAAPTAPAPTPEAQYQNPGTNPFSRTYFTALRALGGADTAHVQRDPQTGQITGVTVANSSPGDQFKRVLAAFASGVAATPGPGPGGATRSIAAGTGAGIKYQQDRQQQQTDESNAAFDNQQKALVTKAQTQLLNQKTAQATWDFARQKVDAAFLDNTRLDTFDKFVRDNGGEQLGTVASWGDLADLRAKDPNIYQDHANGQIVGVPAIENGKVVGMNIARVPPDWGSQRIATDMPLPQIGADGKTTTATVPAGSMSNADYATRYQASLQPILKKQQDDQTAAEKKRVDNAEIAEKYSASAHTQAETKQLNEATDSNQINANAQQLVDGTMDPSNLSKRGKSYDATLAAANVISMKTLGIPFDPAKAAGDYKFATNKGTVDNLNYLNSLTGRDNQSGNLGTVVTMANNIKQTSFPGLNKVDQWAKLESGDPQIAAYHAALVETSDQIAKILQGGGGSGTSDAKLKQAGELLNQGFNKNQISATATTLRTLLANRKQEIIGDNRYLQRWRGAPSQPAGASAEVYAADGKTLTGHIVNGAYVALGK